MRRMSRVFFVGALLLVSAMVAAGICKFVAWISHMKLTTLKRNISTQKRLLVPQRLQVPGEGRGGLPGGGLRQDEHWKIFIQKSWKDAKTDVFSVLDDNSRYFCLGEYCRVITGKNIFGKSILFCLRPNCRWSPYKAWSLRWTTASRRPRGRTRCAEKKKVGIFFKKITENVRVFQYIFFCIFPRGGRAKGGGVLLRHRPVQSREKMPHFWIFLVSFSSSLNHNCNCFNIVRTRNII